MKGVTSLRPTWSERQIGLIALLLALWIPLVWVVTSYLGFSISELSVFFGSDGWCTPDSEGLGIHCFGDHTIIRTYLVNGIYWSDGAPVAAPYPPLPLSVHIGLHTLGNAIAGLRGSIVAFESVLLVCLLVPAWWAGRGKMWPSRVVILLVLGLGATPVLINLDRAQLTGMLVPLVLAFGVAALRKHYIVAAITLGLLGAMKPQFLILGLVLIFHRQWKAIGVTFLTTAIGILLPFALWPGDRVRNFLDWVNTLTDYAGYSDLTTWYPANLSVARALHLLTEVVEQGNSSLGESLRTAVDDYRSVPGLLLLVGAFILVLALRPSDRQTFPVLMLSVLLVISVPGTSYPYYAAALLPLVAMVIRDPRHPATAEFQGVYDVANACPARWTVWTTCAALAFFMAPPPIPGALFFSSFDRPVNLSTAMWAFVVLILIGVAVTQVLQLRRTRPAIQQRPA